MSDDGGPLLGALLRLCHREVQVALDEGFASAGYRRLHGAATQPLWDAPEGLRLTRLAEIAGVSKQAMAEMVDAMVEAGYIERAPDPGDARARLLRLTRRGREAGLFARRLVRGVEARWEARVGRARVAALRETLRTIAETRPADAEHSRSSSPRESPRESPRAASRGRRRTRATETR